MNRTSVQVAQVGARQIKSLVDAIKDSFGFYALERLIAWIELRPRMRTISGFRALEALKASAAIRVTEGAATSTSTTVRLVSVGYAKSSPIPFDLDQVRRGKEGYKDSDAGTLRDWAGDIRRN